MIAMVSPLCSVLLIAVGAAATGLSVWSVARDIEPLPPRHANRRPS